MICLSAITAWAQATPPAVPQAERDAIARNLADDSDMYSRYVFNDAQTVDKKVPIYLPVMPDQDIQDWLVNHVPQILSVNPTTYPYHMKGIAGFFVPNGWEQYQKQWQDANIQSIVSEQNYSTNAMVIDTPRIIAKGRQNVANNPAYRWIAEVPILLTYSKPDTAAQTFNLLLRVGLTRIPMQKDGNLVAVDEWASIMPEKKPEPVKNGW